MALLCPHDGHQRKFVSLQKLASFLFLSASLFSYVFLFLPSIETTLRTGKYLSEIDY